jgi:pimeloyl-ACP methyl ester carboxylesterase
MTTKKGLKTFLIICTRLLVCVITLVLGLLATNKLLHIKESNEIAKAYGEFIEVDGNKMCVNIEGHGDKVVVLLTGWGSPSPVLDMKPLATQLNSNYTVVTVEYLGYGLSDVTDKERSIENITNELHTVLQKLGYTHYTLMAHSISGLYGLYYTNLYPNEVEAFVGIDSSVANEANLKASAAESLQYGKSLRLMNNLGVIRLISKLDMSNVINKTNGYDRSEEECELLRKMYLNKLVSKNVLDEMNLLEQNCAKLQNMTFPDHIPVLFFLASQSIEETPGWKENHEEQFGKNTNSKLVVLDGAHYLYYQYAPEMIEQFIEWQKTTK